MNLRFTIYDLRAAVWGAALAVLFFAGAARADIITATVAVTNTPTTGATIANGADSRMWTNGTVTTPATQIAITNNNILNASNLFYQIAGSKFALMNATWDGVTSNVVFKGAAPLALTLSAGWASITYVTNTTTNALIVEVPMSNFAPSNRATMANGIVAGLNANGTTALATNTAAMQYFVDLFNAQTLSNKVLILGTIYGGMISNVTITNAVAISGVVSNLTNGTFTNPILTNGQNFGNPFRSPGTGAGSEQFGLGASASGVGSAAFGDSSLAAGTGAIAYGYTALASNNYSAALGPLSTALGQYSLAWGYQTIASNTSDTAMGPSALAMGGWGTAVGQGAQTYKLFSTAIGTQATCSNNYSTALGQNSTNTADHQLMLGTVSEYVHVPGYLYAAAQSNITTLTTSTNTFNGAMVIPSASNSSLVNSNNAAVSIGTNSFVQLTGPSGSFFVAGIAGGFAGRLVTLENKSGQIMVLGNQSGVDPTAGNRIVTGYGADRPFTNNPGAVMLRYDGGSSRWEVVGTN